MRKFKNLVIGGIQQKLFNLVLFAIVLIVAAFTLTITWQISHLSKLASETNTKQGEAIASAVQETLDERLTANLGEATQMEAYIADDMFRDVANGVEMMADYAEKLYADPDAYSAREVPLPDASTDGQTTVQLLTASGVDARDPIVARQLALVGNMSDLLVGLFDTSRMGSCYIALPSGVMVLADDHASSKFGEDGTILPIEMTERPWYTGAVAKGGVYFTDVETDVFTGDVGIMCAMPVYRDDELVAVVGADLLLDGMAQAIENSSEGDDFVCIINDQGHVVFSPKEKGAFRVEESSRATDLRQSSGAIGDFVKESLEGITEPAIIEADGTLYYMCGAPIETVGWAVVNAVGKEGVDTAVAQARGEFDAIVQTAESEYTDSLSNSFATTIVVVLLVTGLALAAALVLAKRIVRPLGLITDRIHSLGGNDLLFTVQDDYRTGDEVEVLAESFANLSAKTLGYIDEVKRVTAEKERIGAELNMATAIQASQLPRLFPAFPNRLEFDLFASMDPAREVGGDFYDFFLVDDDHIALVMADVSGKGVPAALFMMVSRVLLKSHLQGGESPATALASVNEQLCEGNDAEFFVTVWAAVVQISTGKGIAANAGHEHPVLCRAGGVYELVIYRHSPALGLMDGIPFREHDFVLHPGDSLFVYTDGVPEATKADNELFGNDRMLDSLNEDPGADPTNVLANVRRSVDAFVGDAEQFDDLTMLCFRYIGPRAEE